MIPALSIGFLLAANLSSPGTLRTPDRWTCWRFVDVTISYLNGLEVFPTFFKSEFGNKEFTIWATVSSRSCFCWLYRALPSLAAKNIINLISVLTIWWCLCGVFSCCWKRVFSMTSAFSWQNSISLCPASFCSKVKYACYSRCFLTSYFCILVLYNEKDIFFVC